LVPATPAAATDAAEQMSPTTATAHSTARHSTAQAGTEHRAAAPMVFQCSVRVGETALELWIETLCAANCNVCRVLLAACIRPHLLLLSLVAPWHYGLGCRGTAAATNNRQQQRRVVRGTSSTERTDRQDSSQGQHAGGGLLASQHQASQACAPHNLTLVPCPSCTASHM
jgi:hypothetical protein